MNCLNLPSGKNRITISIRFTQHQIIKSKIGPEMYDNSIGEGSAELCISGFVVLFMTTFRSISSLL